MWQEYPEDVKECMYEMNMREEGEPKKRNRKEVHFHNSMSSNVTIHCHEMFDLGYQPTDGHREIVEFECLAWWHHV